MMTTVITMRKISSLFVFLLVLIMAISSISVLVAGMEHEGDISQPEPATRGGSFDRCVVVEDFTNVGCPPCKSWNPTLISTTNSYGRDECALVMYHWHYPDNSDYWWNLNQDELGARANLYGVTGVPTTIIDGNDGSDRTGSALSAKIDEHKAEGSPVELQIGGEMDGDSGTVRVTGKMHDSVPASNEYRLVIMVLDDNPGGTEIYNAIDFLDSAQGEDIESRNAGETFTLTKTFTRASNWPAVGDLSLMCFLQDFTLHGEYRDGTIIQAATGGLDGFPAGFGSPPTVTLTKPQAGSEWTDKVDVAWSITDAESSGPFTLTMDYSPDGGTTWNPVGDFDGTDDGSHSWDVSTDSSVLNGDDYKIRIQAKDPDQMTGEAVSEAFKISKPSPPTVELTSPNGKEVWKTEGNIAWTASDNEDNTNLVIDLKYTFDGSNWNDIVTGTSNSGTYTWDLTTLTPEELPDSSSYKVKIIATDTDTMSAEDISDSFFEIDRMDDPSISITGPPEILKADGSGVLKGTQSIQWTATDDEDGTDLDIDIELSSDGGTSWEDLEKGLSNTGKYSWETTTVPDGESYKLRITATDSDGLSQSPVSEQFSILNTELPELGADVRIGDNGDGTFSISWDITLGTFDKSEIIVNVYYRSLDTRAIGDEWELVDSVDPLEPFTWDVEEMGEGSYQIMVEVIPVGYEEDAVTMESAEFFIDQPDMPVIEVMNPQNGDKVESGSLDLSWMATDKDVDDFLTVSIEWTDNGGVTWIVLEENLGDSGTLEWDTSELDNGDYKLRFSVTDSTELVSDPVEITITISNPVEGEGEGEDDGEGEAEGEAEAEAEGEADDGEGEGDGDGTVTWNEVFADSTDSDGDGVPDLYEKEVLNKNPLLEDVSPGEVEDYQNDKQDFDDGKIKSDDPANRENRASTESSDDGSEDGPNWMPIIGVIIAIVIVVLVMLLMVMKKKKSTASKGPAGAGQGQTGQVSPHPGPYATQGVAPPASSDSYNPAQNMQNPGYQQTPQATAQAQVCPHCRTPLQQGWVICPTCKRNVSSSTTGTVPQGAPPTYSFQQ